MTLWIAVVTNETNGTKILVPIQQTQQFALIFRIWIFVIISKASFTQGM